ncbi:DUF4761 domain-containing protein [Pantoea agglomerans]|uniref:DUF4761 domain-containing protein n=1 Tax=Enterobacter agglomerans TaxID=549 RepID=UPI0017810EC0|nr:DUF4761 domain-containing protein [Pantoea agglomerans]WVL84724.1 DUF4761 domain-containing protein [Pantoea agglomerans]
MHQLIRANKFITLYRGFTIAKSPRTPVRPRNQYGISKEGVYYGCEFAEAEAMRFIDQLHSERSAVTHA